MIDLTAIPLASAQPEVQDFGGLLTPPLGGPVQRINRVGTRWAVSFETPNLPADPALRLWSGRIARAKIEGAVCWIPEPDLLFTLVGAVAVRSATSGGNVLRLVAATAPPGRLVPEGKWVSYIHDGRRYLHRTTADAVVIGGGALDLPVFPALRSITTIGDTVEVDEPRMQGTLSIGSMLIPLERAAPLTFSISEDE